MALLEVDRLNVRLHGRHLLRDVSLQLNKGEILGLVGESGSGKSLTSLAVMGLLPEAAQIQGDLRLDGEPLPPAGSAAMRTLRGRRIGLVFQEPMTALNPLLSIGEQVAETVRLHRRCSRREALLLARRALDRVGLPADQFDLRRYPHELSGGQRQRVVIAIAIVLQPDVLIADEPTTALDVVTQAQILELLQGLAREDGIGVVLITHDLAVVAQVTDRLVIMYHGEVVESGQTSSLLQRLEHPYSQALLSDAQRLPRRLQAGDAESPVLLDVSGVGYALGGSRRWPWQRSTDRQILQDVSLQIRRGENVGLVGESGCGKSTLLRLLLALERPSAGRISLDGQDLVGARGAALRALRQKIQVVFQDPYGSFDPSWTVERIIAEPLYLFDRQLGARERRQRVDMLLEQVGLPSATADRYPHEFSGGQRQRIAIARALISEPAIIALDEAVSALDVRVRAQVLQLLADLSDRLGLSYLFVSHDLSVVRGITDRVYVMQQGRIVESGETESVFRAPANDFTRRLLAALPHFPAAQTQPH